MSQCIVSSRSTNSIVLRAAILVAVAAALLVPPTLAAAQQGGAYGSDNAGEQTSAEPSSGANAAQVPLTQEEINKTALSLSIKYMSPYCPGSNLRDCTSGNAATLREEIRAWVAAGRSEQWISNELVSRYGESILSAPRFRGFNILVWVFPFIAVLVGLGVIFTFLKRQHKVTLDHRTPAKEAPKESTASPALERELEAELTHRLR